MEGGFREKVIDARRRGYMAKQKVLIQRRHKWIISYFGMDLFNCHYMPQGLSVYMAQL
jgi:hypothetical protein